MSKFLFARGLSLIISEKRSIVRDNAARTLWNIRLRSLIGCDEVRRLDRSTEQNGATFRNRTALRIYRQALFFSIGVLLGQVLAFFLTGTVSAELRRYLFAVPVPEGRVPVTGGTVLLTSAAYLFYPLLAAVLGWCFGGGGLLCGVSAGFGCSLSFSVGCFAAALGRRGIGFAAAALGIRCLITIPCFFATVGSGRQSRSPGAPAGRQGRGNGIDVLPFLVLLAGIGAELWLTPKLLRWAFGWLRPV